MAGKVKAVWCTAVTWWQNKQTKGTKTEAIFAVTIATKSSEEVCPDDIKLKRRRHIWLKKPGPNTCSKPCPLQVEVSVAAFDLLYVRDQCPSQVDPHHLLTEKQTGEHWNTLETCTQVTHGFLIFIWITYLTRLAAVFLPAAGRWRRTLWPRCTDFQVTSPLKLGCIL